MDRIDEIDTTILQLLQENGRMKRNAIAEIVDLSVPSVSERMRKLEERGVITGYHAVVDPKRLHFDITSFIRVTVDGSEHFDPFVAEAMSFPEVLEVHSITGEGSHILKIRTKNTTSLERLLSKVQALPGVHGTSTSIVLSTFKETQAVQPSPMELAEYDREKEPVPS
ncbi:MAG: Lrp/AsnC family transcriptional regulator [Rhodothermales bacterium]